MSDRSSFVPGVPWRQVREVACALSSGEPGESNAGRVGRDVSHSRDFLYAITN